MARFVPACSGTIVRGAGMQAGTTSSRASAGAVAVGRRPLGGVSDRESSCGIPDRVRRSAGAWSVICSLQRGRVDGYALLWARRKRIRSCASPGGQDEGIRD